MSETEKTILKIVNMNNKQKLRMYKSNNLQQVF